MKHPILGGISTAVFMLLASGCADDARQDSGLVVDGTNNNVIVPQVAPSTTPGPLTAQAWVDDFSIGKALGPEGVVTEDQDTFAPGETVHLSMKVDDAPAGAAITVQWYGPDDASLGEETKTVTGQQATMAFARETGEWQQGDYRAEVWVGDEKVNEQHFEVDGDV